MRVLAVTQGGWGERIAQHLSRTAPSDWALSAWSGPRNLPMVIDEPDAHLPDSLPEADLVVVLTESPGLTDLAPDIAARCAAQAAIVAVDRRSAAPPGLQSQVRRRLETMGVGAALPMPFCSLAPRPNQHPLVRAFAARYGRAEFACSTRDGMIDRCDVLREAPCGNSRYIAERLAGVPIAEAVERAGLLHHYYPCWGDMQTDPVHGSHTLLHIAATMAQRAVSRTLGEAETGKTR